MAKFWLTLRPTHQIKLGLDLKNRTETKWQRVI